MNSGTQSPTATAVGGGILAGLVVCVGCLLPIWLAGSGRGERGLEAIWGWFLPLLGLWAATSAGAATFCQGSTVATALRAATLGLFGFPLAFVVLFLVLSSIGIPDPGPLSWPWLVLCACVIVLSGASLGAVVARREFSTGSESAVLGDDESEEPHVERRFDWGKISRVCGTLGLLLVLLVSASRQRSAEGAFYVVVFFLFPGLLLSTVAILVGLWTRAGRGWISGLVAWLWFFAMGYLR